MAFILPKCVTLNLFILLTLINSKIPNLKINEIKCNTLATNLASSVDQRKGSFCAAIIQSEFWFYKLGNCANSNKFLAFMYMQIVYWQGTMIKVRS